MPPVSSCRHTATIRPILVTLPAATFDYRVAGEFLRDGQPVNPPLSAVAFDRPVAIMKHHVSRADYQRCVAARACKPIAANTPSNGDAIPAVGVSWYDAVAYAAWLSRRDRPSLPAADRC